MRTIVLYGVMLCIIFGVLLGLANRPGLIERVRSYPANVDVLQDGIVGPPSPTSIPSPEQRKPVSEAIRNARQSGADFSTRRLFSSRASRVGRDARFRKVVDDGVLLDLDHASTARLAIDKARFITLQLPDGKGSFVELDLEQVDIVAPGFKVNTPNGPAQNIEESIGLHYRGIVKGNDDSLAAISVFRNEVLGFYSTTSDGNFVLGRLGGNNPSNEHILYNDKSLKPKSPFHCDTIDSGRILPETALLEPEEILARCVRVYVEANHDVYLNQGSVANTLILMAGLFNQVAVLYANEGIPVSLSEVFVWTTPSPYTGTTSLQQLESFRAIRTSFNGNLAHLVTLQQNLGGVAYRPGLCNSNFGYAFSGIFSTYSNVPTYSWSVNVFTHEMGHNLGSSHTQACVWNGNNTAIDGCVPPESANPPQPPSCGLGPLPPLNGGTMMSYCHLNAQVGINFNLGFGTQPRNVILNTFNGAACVADCGPIPSPTPTPTPSPTPADLVATKASSLAPEWTRQFGTIQPESASEVSVDALGNSYVVGSTFGSLSGSSAGAYDVFVRKYDSAGTEVWTRQFGTDTDDGGNGIAVDTSGNSFVAGGTLGTLPGQTALGFGDAFLRKHDSAGNVVWTRQFGSSDVDNAAGVAVDAGGNSYVLGKTHGTLPGQTSSGGTDAFVRKFDGSGNTLWTRQFGTASFEEGYGIGVDAAGNIYVTGITFGAFPGHTNSGNYDAYIRKYDPAGNEVWTRQFGNNSDDIARGIAVDPTGNSYVAGSTGDTFGPNRVDAFVRKYDAAGNFVWTRELATTADELGWCIAMDMAGNIYVGGSPNFVRKYNSSGDVLWMQYFGSTSGSINGVAGYAYGRLFVAGATGGTLPGQTSSGSTDAYVQKYDASFCTGWTWNITTVNQGPGSAPFAAGQTILVDDLPAGNIGYGLPVAGSFSNVTGSQNISTSITGNTLNVTATGPVTISPGGGFTVGFASTPTGTGTFASPRSGGTALVDPNNVIYENNETNNAFSDTVAATSCQITGRRPLFDYDGDGRTDFSVFRPSSGIWYLQRSTTGFQSLQWGANGDVVAPADYDGDGKADVVVFRPSIGRWYILRSATGTASYPIFGTNGDLPAPGDYDGDGKADISVFRPSQGTWYRENSSNGSFTGMQFGQNGDIPTVGDFDGDLRNDIGIWRPSNGDWYNIRSSNGSVFGERFGQTGDKIAPADYDGDGKTDIAIFRPSTGLWVVRNSATATYSYHVFGAPSDIPIAGDYDGDGKADIGVWRPSDGTWYIQRSDNGQFIVFPWGQNGDKPTPAAFGS